MFLAITRTKYLQWLLYSKSKLIIYFVPEKNFFFQKFSCFSLSFISNTRNCSHSRLNTTMTKVETTPIRLCRPAKDINRKAKITVRLPTRIIRLFFNSFIFRTNAFKRKSPSITTIGLE